MFGYITVNSAHLSEQEKKTYRGYYCGLCRSLGDTGGIFCRASLSYDMTFLAILLSGLYDADPRVSLRRCLLHPVKQHEEIVNKYTYYAADMNILLAYYDLMDDWKDDRNLRSLLESSLLRARIKHIKEKYPRQHAAVVSYVDELYGCEKKNITDIDVPSSLTGKMLAEIFTCDDDMWKKDLADMGFYLGKFIYLMDAFEDAPEDIKKGNYNPFGHIFDSSDHIERCRQILMMQMADCCRAFERLPIIENIGILRNVLYSGVWIAFARKINSSQEKSNS